MKRIAWLAIAACIAVGMAAAAAAPSGERSAQPALTVEAIVARNVEARGGLEAWRKIDTMVWTGHIDTDKSPAGVQFLLEMKRPNKTREEPGQDGDRASGTQSAARGPDPHMPHSRTKMVTIGESPQAPRARNPPAPPLSPAAPPGPAPQAEPAPEIAAPH